MNTRYVSDMKIKKVNSPALWKRIDGLLVNYNKDAIKKKPTTR